MKKVAFVSLGILICLFFACNMKWYKFTSKLKCDKLYIEVFQVNYFGVDTDYLTDSANFKMYVGRFDEEHETFQYRCLGDSIFIVKFQWGNRDTTITLPDGTKVDTTPSDTIEKKSFSISQLKKQHKFE